MQKVKSVTPRERVLPVRVSLAAVADLSLKFRCVISAFGLGIPVGEGLGAAPG